MLKKEASKKERFLILLLVLVFVVTIIAGVWLALNSIKIGPGLPPPEAMPSWYIPDAYKGNEHVCTSLFPNISPYCKSVNTSEGKFMNVWYFNEESEFLKGEDTLYRYLNENGNVSKQELNISTELQEKIKRDEANNAWGPTFGSHSFNVTGYESPETSGYFLVYERPFLETREDYFIVYYGSMGMANHLTQQTPDFKKLIAESYYIAMKKVRLKV